MTDVLIVHYNTPELTEACIRSLRKHTPGARVTVFDNSDRRPFLKNGWMRSDVRVLDNTRGQIVDWKPWLTKFPDKIPCGNGYGSAKHCYSVDVCMDRFPDGFVLMDSDVLVRRDIAPIADRRYPWVGKSHCNVRPFGFQVRRVNPFLCFVNAPMLLEHGIRYFDPGRMWGLHDDGYDTGAVLYADCQSVGLHGKEVDISEYAIHLRNASWKERPVQEWLSENRKLWE